MNQMSVEYERKPELEGAMSMPASDDLLSSKEVSIDRLRSMPNELLERIYIEALEKHQSLNDMIKFMFNCFYVLKINEIMHSEYSIKAFHKAIQKLPLEPLEDSLAKLFLGTIPDWLAKILLTLPHEEPSFIRDCLIKGYQGNLCYKGLIKEKEPIVKPHQLVLFMVGAFPKIKIPEVNNLLDAFLLGRSDKALELIEGLPAFNTIQENKTTQENEISQEKYDPLVSIYWSCIYAWIQSGNEEFIKAGLVLSEKLLLKGYPLHEEENRGGNQIADVKLLTAKLVYEFSFQESRLEEFILKPSIIDSTEAELAIYQELKRITYFKPLEDQIATTFRIVDSRKISLVKSAIRLGHIQIVTAMRPSLDHYELTICLHQAVLYEQEEIVKFLLSSLNENFKGTYGEEKCMSLAENKNLRIFELLWAERAHVVNRKSSDVSILHDLNSYLYEAIEKGAEKVVALLLEKRKVLKKDINDCSKTMTLELACLSLAESLSKQGSEKHDRIAKLLWREVPQKASAALKYFNVSPSFASQFVFYYARGAKTIANWFFQAVCNSKNSEKLKFTALLLAIRCGHKAVAEFLVKNGVACFPKHKDLQTNTILLAAIDGNHLGMVQWSLDQIKPQNKVRTVNASYKTETCPLAHACSIKNINIDIIRLLLSEGASFQYENTKLAAWQSVCEQGRHDIVVLLLEKIDDIDESIRYSIEFLKVVSLEIFKLIFNKLLSRSSTSANLTDGNASVIIRSTIKVLFNNAFDVGRADIMAFILKQCKDKGEFKLSIEDLVRPPIWSRAESFEVIDLLLKEDVKLQIIDIDLLLLSRQSSLRKNSQLFFQIVQTLFFNMLEKNDLIAVRHIIEGAYRSEDSEVLNLLNLEYKGKSALQIALAKSTEMVTLLLERGAKIERLLEYLSSPLPDFPESVIDKLFKAAMRSNQIDKMELLNEKVSASKKDIALIFIIDTFYIPRWKRDTMIQWLSEQHDSAKKASLTVAFLLQNGASLNKGISLIQQKRVSGLVHPKIIIQFFYHTVKIADLKACCYFINIIRTDNIWVKLPDHIVENAVSHGHFEIIELLLKNENLVKDIFEQVEANIIKKLNSIHLTSEQQVPAITPEQQVIVNSLLIFSVQRNKARNLEKLAKHCDNINFALTNGPTALYYAVANGNEDIVEFLLNQGADVEGVWHEKEDGSFQVFYPLNIGLRNKIDFSIVKKLVDRSAYIPPHLHGQLLILAVQNSDISMQERFAKETKVIDQAIVLAKSNKLDEEIIHILSSFNPSLQEPHTNNDQKQGDDSCSLGQEISVNVENNKRKKMDGGSSIVSEPPDNQQEKLFNGDKETNLKCPEDKKEDNSAERLPKKQRTDSYGSSKLLLLNSSGESLKRKTPGRGAEEQFAVLNMK